MTKLRPCTCDSGEVAEPHYDARGIFLCYACSTCWPEKQKRYRADVLTNPNYDAEEAIEPD